MPYFPQAGPISPASGITPQAMGDTWSNLFASIDPVFLSMFGTYGWFRFNPGHFESFGCGPEQPHCLQTLAFFCVVPSVWVVEPLRFVPCILTAGQALVVCPLSPQR